MTQAPAPGADLDRAVLRAVVAQLEAIIRDRAASAWCTARWRLAPCVCWRCTALRLCRYVP